MKQQKGISFTLTLVVVGVVLLLAALFLIAILGQGLGGARDSIGDQQSSNEIRNVCNSVESQINSQFCSQYVTSGCSSPQVSADADHARKASSRDCGWGNYGGLNDLTEVVDSSCSGGGCSSIVVQTSEGTFDCVAEGLITDTTC